MFYYDSKHIVRVDFCPERHGDRSSFSVPRAIFEFSEQHVPKTMDVLTPYFDDALVNIPAARHSQQP